MTKHARVSMKIVKDIDMKKFDELKRRINSGRHEVLVGIPAGSKEADGTPVAMIAAVHEFGSTARGIPERPVYRVFYKKNQANYVRLNRINLIKVLRGQMTIEQALGQLGEMAKGDIQTEIRNGKFVPLDPKTIKARQRARSNEYNHSLRKKAARKGAGPIDRPLIDTGQMIQSVTWVLKE